MRERPTKTRFHAALALTTAILTACGGGAAVDPVPVIGSFVASPPSISAGTSTRLSWVVNGASSISVDHGVGLVTGTSIDVSPASTTTYTLTATSSGGSVTRATVVVVTAAALEVACSGSGCGATNPSQYSGSGIGIWRLRNQSASTLTIDVGIAGIPVGRKVALVFTNGGSTDVPSLPGFGALATPALATSALSLPLEPDEALPERDAWHEGLLQMNQEIAGSLSTLPVRARATSLVEPVAPSPTPSVGDTRSWMELLGPPVQSYSTVARAVCPLPGGRKAIFWVDPAATAANHVTDDDLTYFTSTVCGNTTGGAPSDLGGYGRVRTLLGEPWGPSIYGDLIPDSPALQNVNIVFVEVPATGQAKTWAGYFYSLNNFFKATYPTSNEALVFFLDASQIHLSPASRGYFGSALLHELTHMVNFYQVNVSRQVTRDTWLEELTATMTDDIVSPAATPDGVSIIPSQRIRPYVASGGDVSLVKWLYPTQNSYSLAGAFAAFVDRRYGTSILGGTRTCATGNVSCIDGLIRAAGGTSFADDLERVGPSIFGLFPATGFPDGYGYPQKVSDGYTLAPIDVSTYAAYLKPTPTILGYAFEATSHLYRVDTVTSGTGTYVRTGITVPGGTSLHVVIK